jgi:hypothetical protein
VRFVASNARLVALTAHESIDAGGRMSGLAGDLRLTIRVLRRSPWWTALAVAMLGIGIGATTALFSLVDAVAVRQRDGALAVRGEAVSANFVEVFGVQPVLGRGFVPEDAAPGAEPVMLVSFAFWERYFDGDVNVSGQVVFVDDVPYTVIGVMPRPFQTTFLGPPSVFWTPYAHSRSPQRERDLGVEIVARLAQASRQPRPSARFERLQQPSLNRLGRPLAGSP